ncbi:asparaginase [Paenibacillus lignilyticus]|uniref:Asparaginase n=1 Tax=Paenibacillus lignilyticus TaxID=1172615 RepID=A0ABS5CAF9_9BACL|nr:asparaginase [Paenibacillus lignilyticus]MBP3962914.1 asparaginase [Paenibacillus lignilyticus]
MSEVLVNEYRGGYVENVHYGHICGVDANGIRYGTGNVRHLTFLRSSGKPIQALPALIHGADEAFGLSEKETAIMSGSHWAETFHVSELESMMVKIGIAEEQLVCSPTYPLNGAARDELFVSGSPKRRIYHNCSGKHLGILSLCKHKGYDLQGYTDTDHPAQQEIAATLAYLAAMPVEEVVTGVDGCGCPVFAIPLDRLATAYLKLALPELIEDHAVRRAAIKIAGLMNRHPEMVSGSGQICSILLLDDNIVAKGGAKGVYCFGLREEGLGFALKVLDGSQEEWPLIIASILEQIGYSRQETIDRLRALAPADMLNDNGIVAGRNEAVFKLQRYES